MTNYAVTVTREGKWWMIAVPELDGLTQARRLSEVETMARSLIAVTLDVPVDSFTITCSVQVVGSVAVADRLRELEAERAELAAMERHVRADQIRLARDLAAQHLPVRDIGAALGVSFQRAQQLVAS